MATHHHALLWCPAEHRLVVNQLLTLTFGEYTTVGQPYYHSPDVPPVQPVAAEIYAAARWVPGETLETLQQTMAARVEADDLVPAGGWASVGMTKQQAIDAAESFLTQIAGADGYDNAVQAANIAAWKTANKFYPWVDPEEEE